MSGPAVKPLALAGVWEVSGKVDIPVVASGGATTATDVLEFMTVGASAVQVGTALFMCPTAGKDIIRQLSIELEGAGVPRVADLIGRFRPRPDEV